MLTFKYLDLFMKQAFAALVTVLSLLLPAQGVGQTTPLPPVPVPPENPITEEKRILGKILFWDEQLSSDNSVACGTCHIPAAGGTDPRSGIHPGPDNTVGTDDDVIGSKGVVALSSSMTPVAHPLFGFDVQVTDRSAPSFIGAMYAPAHFWDGRADSRFTDPETGATVIASGGALESQAVGPIMSTVEMAHQGRNWNDVGDKLQAAVPLALATTNVPADIKAKLADGPDYPALFEEAFGDGAITASRIGMAIATYERTLLPDQTPWDHYNAGNTGAMTAQQIRGWKQMQKDSCLECHVPPVFTDHKFYNIGLRPSHEDLGRQNITGNPADRGRFKTPTLRNVGLVKHLGHVGWLTDAMDAIDFYNAGGGMDLTSPHVQFTEDQTPLPVSGLAYQEVQVAPLHEDIQDDVAEFLKTALTDPRVAAETFPFDRPTLRSEFGPAATGNQLKLMSYDIGTGTWDSARADRVAAVIGASLPDVIGLQQAAASPLADLKTRLGNDYLFVATAGTQNYNPILVRKAAFSVQASGGTAQGAMLSCGTNSYVNFAVLRQAGTGRRLTFHNTRLCDPDTDAGALPSGFTGAQINQAHAADLANLMNQNKQAYGAPTVAVGGFNAGSGDAAMKFLVEQLDLPGPVANPVVLDDSYKTANGKNNPGEHAILFEPRLMGAASSLIVRNPSTLLASAQLPVASVIEISPGLDADGDGVADALDNCVYRANPTQSDKGGLNSAAADGIGDACQCGDMNADGKVTNTDAVLIQRHLLGLASPFSEALCDVNGGGCSNTDAVIIRRALVGLPPGVSQNCTAAARLP